MKMLWVGIAGMLLINNSHTFSPPFLSFFFFWCREADCVSLI